MGRLCCPKCCEGYHEELDHCPRCGPLRPDCDAYEKRIAELEAALTRETLIGIDAKKQLARVKAESLRVVEDVEAAELDKIQRHQYVQWEGHVCVPDKLRVELVRITDNHRYDVRQQYCDSFRFSPVRLERWETEE